MVKNKTKQKKLQFIPTFKLEPARPDDAYGQSLAQVKRDLNLRSSLSGHGREFEIENPRNAFAIYPATVL